MDSCLHIPLPWISASRFICSVWPFPLCAPVYTACRDLSHTAVVWVTHLSRSMSFFSIVYMEPSGQLLRYCFYRWTSLGNIEGPLGTSVYFRSLLASSYSLILTSAFPSLANVYPSLYLYRSSLTHGAQALAFRSVLCHSMVNAGSHTYISSAPLYTII